MIFKQFMIIFYVAVTIVVIFYSDHIIPKKVKKLMDYHNIICTKIVF